MEVERQGELKQKELQKERQKRQEEAKKASKNFKIN